MVTRLRQAIGRRILRVAFLVLGVRPRAFVCASHPVFAADPAALARFAADVWALDSLPAGAVVLLPREELARVLAAVGKRRGE